MIEYTVYMNISNKAGEMMFDLKQFDDYREDNRREVKKASGGLPRSLWETYSAFANSYGGVIILGVSENDDGSWQTTGLENPAKLCHELWDMLNNPNKVSVNLLSDGDVQIYQLGGDAIIVIQVPVASRSERPVYINGDFMKGSYRRNGEGDYRCTPQEVRGMLRDQPEQTMDMQILEDWTLEDLNAESVQAYRNLHRSWKPSHVWGMLSDEEYLRNIGAAAVAKSDGKLHPTAAGMLMFGNEYDIVRVFPEYFLDYRETLDPSIRWTDRLQSSSGDWSGNIFDFFFRVYNKIVRDIKVPFSLEGGVRVDDTSVHKAVREVLANCLVNYDVYIARGVVVKKSNDALILENPGTIRVGKQQMRIGGESDPRNKTLMKMFNLINIGERAGSGVPDVLRTWQEQGWGEPIIEERFGDAARTFLTLPFYKRNEKRSKKTIEKNNRKKQSKKTIENKDRILEYLSAHEAAYAKEIAAVLGLSDIRTRAILNEMIAEGTITTNGAVKKILYQLSEKQTQQS